MCTGSARGMSTGHFAERALRNIWPRSRRSLRLDAGELDHLAPLLGFLADHLAEVGGRARKCSGAQLGKPRLYLGIGKSRVDLLVELLHDLGRRGLRCGDAVPETRFVARHRLTDSRHVG